MFGRKKEVKCHQHRKPAYSVTVLNAKQIIESFVRGFYLSTDLKLEWLCQDCSAVVRTDESLDTTSHTQDLVFEACRQLRDKQRELTKSETAREALSAQVVALSKGKK